MNGPDLGFPLGVRLAHWFNVLFLIMLMRSGLAILASHPKLYWNVDSRPGSEWLWFTRKKMPDDRLWCSTDEEEEWPGWLALPGGHGLGLGRYWHFLNAMGWLACGLAYLAVLFTSDQWRRLVPTSWQVFPLAFHDMLMYMTLRTPPDGTPYGPSPFNPLQQLTYFGLVFVLTPLQILTGLAQSPALLARFPLLERLFGSRQGARSVHFLGLVAFAGFLVIHLVMVFWHGFAEEMNKMVMGREHDQNWIGPGIGLAIVGLIVLANVAANAASEGAKKATHSFLAALVDPVRNLILHRFHSVQNYPEKDISPFFRVNGYPPIAAYPQAQGGDPTYEALMGGRFADYRFEVGGLVESPRSFSLDDLRALPKQEQTTLHNCIQGWSSIGRWGGVRVSEVLALCRPQPGARYLVFTSFGFHETPGGVRTTDGHRYYECIDMIAAEKPQTILAYELNGEPLPVQHGAPLRLRLETKLGFKMVKFLHSMEVVADYKTVGGGRGGVREDTQQFDMGAEI